MEIENKLTAMAAEQIAHDAGAVALQPSVLLERAEFREQLDDAAGARAAREEALRIYREIGAALDKFFAGEYAGDYEAALIEEFEACLPENPPWQTA